MVEDTHLPFGMIQVAGVHDLPELSMLLEEGVDLVGFPLRLTVNAEDLTEAEAAVLSRRFPGKCCLITYLDQLSDIRQLVQYLEVDWLQLHGPIDVDLLPALRDSLPELRIIKSLIVGKYSEADLLRQVEAMTPHVSAFITDSFHPSTGAEGATGLTHDWPTSRRICEATDCPVILAGGLTPENVDTAIRATRPYGVDVHTGVEQTNGRKSRDRVREFVSQARQAFAETSPS